MNKIGRIIALFFAAITVTVAIPLSTSASQVSIDVTTDNLEVKFYRPDSNFTRFTGSTYIQRYSSDFAGVHYSQVFNRKFNNFFSSSSGTTPSDFNGWSLRQYLTVDNAIINLDSDYIELAYYVAFSELSDLKAASLIFDDPSHPGIELGSDFYTVERLKGDGVHLNGYSYYYRLKFYFKTERVFDYFDSLNPVIKNFDFYIEFSNVDVDYIFFSDIYYSTNSDQAVLDAIANCSGQICGKLDDVAVLISNAMHEDLSDVKESIDKTYDFLSEEPDEEASLDESSEKVSESIGNLEAAEDELDSYKVDIDIDINAILSNMPNKTFDGIKTILDDILSTQYLSTAIMLSLSVGLITFAIGRRVR